MLIAQISDLHLRPEGVLYQGVVDSTADFAACVAALNALSPQPDLILLTGDLVDDGKPVEYATAVRLLAQLRAPVFAIPGNHDEWGAFRASLAGHDYLPPQGPFHFVIGDHGPLRIIALDVTVPGKHHGNLDEPAAQWLERTLAEEPGHPTLIMMHQPPFATGIPYLDPYACWNGDRLAGIVARYPAVERILCGHVHRAMQVRFAGTLLCTAPSTTTTIALQLTAGAKPASVKEPPAFLLHDWRDGHLVTHHVLVGEFPGPYPFA